MAIHKDNKTREISFECDGCGEICDTQTKDFTEAKDHIKSEGWVIKKPKEEWLHFCNKDCAKFEEEPD